MAAANQPYTLADTWLLNNRVNLKLLEHLSPEQLTCAPNPRARSIGEQLAHLHNVRIAWLEVMAGGGPPKIEKGDAAKELLARSLEASGAAIAEVLASAEQTGKLRGFRRGPVAFLGYLLAHEAHHRGQIILHLKQAKMPVDKMVAFGLWEWEKL
jgi:uncharacterized damage-inducible protein DinB